jgi:hypothetical protein
MCFYTCIYVTVYMYVLCINVYISTDVYMHTWPVYKGVCVYTDPMHSRSPTNTHTQHIYVCVCVCVCACVCVCVFVCIYIHTYIHTYICIHTHTLHTDADGQTEGAPLPKKIFYFCLYFLFVYPYYTQRLHLWQNLARD